MIENMNTYPGQLVFGLDIGTRSIVGTTGYKEEDIFYVVAQEIREHETRAMKDGQIHDINKVGATIRSVKEALEQKTGRKLSEVCIAAAGRVLQTVTTHVDMVFEGEKLITREDIYALDSAGVEQGYTEFQKTNLTGEKFYCVGYSVIHYYMNGHPMGNLENHKAHEVGEELIATFLPGDVVDGLYRAVELSGLQVASMTLEPIAAIQVAIPEKFRMLNMALVDVGAGTSDISITKGGSITAYGMLPCAGDGLTEAISQFCLVEFATAEKIKKDITEKEVVEYVDIMGLPQRISREEVLSILEPIVDSMAGQAAEKIKELNGDKPVSAVFVVGGGGKIATYTDKLAAELGIQTERVAIRGKEVMGKIEFLEENVEKDALLVTPIGICLNFYEQSNNFIYVSFNGERVRLYDNGRLAIVDAAMQADFPKEALFPRRGRELNFTVDGKSRIVRGQLGEAAEITLGGDRTDIYQLIHANDVITVKASTEGEAAYLEVRKLPEYAASITVIVNGTKVELPKFVDVNNSLQSGYYAIQEGDRLELLDYITVEQIAEFMDVAIDKRLNIYVNNKLADVMTKAYENFTVTWTMEKLVFDGDKEDEDYLFREEAEGLEDDEEVVYKREKKAEAPVEKAENRSLSLLVNGKPIQMEGKSSYVFVDIFEYVDFDLSQVRGSGIVAKRNGEQAQYMEPLEQGDSLEIFWKD